MQTLDNIKKGKKVIVVKINAQGAIRRRLRDMGITNGVIIKVLKFAPLGDPMEILLRGYSLTLRKADASLIEVEEEK
jgi:ferrous iron transport protein A